MLSHVYTVSLSLAIEIASHACKNLPSILCTQGNCVGDRPQTQIDRYSGAFPPQFFSRPSPNTGRYQSRLSLLGLRQLLLPEPAEEARTHDELRNQSDPEPRFFETMYA